MYKIINILLFIGLLNTSIFAETTKEDVDKYLEISRGGAIVQDRFVFRYKKYFTIMYDEDIEKADRQAIKKYKAFIFNSKYEDIFYKTFTQLDDTSYYEIMAFYNTKLGKKYAQSFQELYQKDFSEKIMTLIFAKLTKELVPQKRKLVAEINKVLYSKLHIDLEKDIFIVGSSKEVKTYQIFSNKKNGLSTKEMKALLDEYIEIFNEVAYRHFSDEELSQILKYAKTYGKIEMGVLHHALKLNIDAFKKDLKEFINKKTASK